MESFLVSTGTVFLGEIGDKTQLLAIILASRFKKPWPIVVGILVATTLNHAVAAWAGNWIAATLSPDLLRWIVGASFLGVGLWALKPDTASESEVKGSGSAFVVTTVSFFLAEIGDKTQIATTVLAARFNELVPVVAGTTLGMLLANVPVVFLGAALAQRLPLGPIRLVAAATFIALGVVTLVFGGRLVSG